MPPPPRYSIDLIGPDADRPTSRRRRAGRGNGPGGRRRSSPRERSMRPSRRPPGSLAMGSSKHVVQRLPTAVAALEVMLDRPGLLRAGGPRRDRPAIRRPGGSHASSWSFPPWDPSGAARTVAPPSSRIRSDLRPDQLRDIMPGHVDGADGHPQLGRQVDAASALDGGDPEGPPAGLLDPRPHPVDRGPEESLVLQGRFLLDRGRHGPAIVGVGDRLR